jgi:hypothetical protein
LRPDSWLALAEVSQCRFGFGFVAGRQQLGVEPSIRPSAGDFLNCWPAEHSHRSHFVLVELDDEVERQVGNAADDFQEPIVVAAQQRPLIRLVIDDDLGSITSRKSFRFCSCKTIKRSNVRR